VQRHIGITLLSHSHRSVRSIPEPAASEPVSPADQRRHEEIEQELQLARDIQQGLLLEAVPRLAGWEISAISLPARDLGGDLYDFLPLGAVSHGIMIGDVSGKGLPAALRMAVARTVFRHAARRNEPPSTTLAATNAGVLLEIPQGMVTMLYATLDLQRGELRIANAGHTFPIVINGQVEEIELSGLPLGVDGDSDYAEARVTLDPGTTALLYTDGVVEATNRHGDIFGFERLESVLHTRSHLRPRSLVAALLQEVRAWSDVGQTDDITVVAIRRRLAQLAAELRLVADDVLGPERAARLWAELALPGDDAPAPVWLDILPGITRFAQETFGRGLGRELHGQMRLTIEEYRAEDL
jgi:sigma-B regulation protein RsbU (phosphoserine phosphatase)